MCAQYLLGHEFKVYFSVFNLILSVCENPQDFLYKEICGLSSVGI